VVENFQKLELDALIMIGGDGSMAIAEKLLLKVRKRSLGEFLPILLASTEFFFPPILLAVIRRESRLLVCPRPLTMICWRLT